MAISVRRTRSATQNYMQHQSCLYRRVNWNDPGVTLAATAAGSLQIGTLPPGAMPLDTIVRINTAFTEGVTIQTTASTGDVVARADLAFGSTGTTVDDRITILGYSTDERPIYFATATVGTAGQADVWVRFLDIQGKV
jgi:hypothetical protein